MEKMKMQSKDRTQENFEKLAALFPNAVTETITGYDEDGNAIIERAIDKDVLQQEISAVVVEGRDERYQFTWPDKKKSILAANAPIRKTLRPCREESVDFDNTENLYIEGDNLDVLKLLQETYLGKVKMIYIDPPYNTGHDFVYNDDFKESTDEYMENSGQLDDEGNRLFQNTESNGRFHTDWLNMLYPRLKIARDLLSDDGVIFISIDDNEFTNLRKIGAEIFGENNVETLIWNKASEGSSGTLKQISSTRRIHEYILCLFKNYSLTRFSKVHEALKGRENEFQTANLAVNLEHEKTDHPNYFTITNPDGESFTRQWKWSKSEIDELIKQNLIYWGSDGHKQPRLIIPTDDRRTTYLLSILEYGGTTVGRKDYESVMDSSIEAFYPKPVVLLYKLIETASNDNSIIMDFFSGTSTTAQAVIRLNAKYGSKRKFIMVQLEEKCDENSEAYKAGYKNICEIGKERIRRAGAQIMQNAQCIMHNDTGSKDQQNLDGDSNSELCSKNSELDIGFRVLKLDSTNMKDVYYNPHDVQMSILDNLESNIKEDRTPEDLLFQVMLDLGILLSSKIAIHNVECTMHNDNNSELCIKNYEFFDVADGFLIACFDNDVTEEVITEIAKKQPAYFVMRDSSMKNDSVATNFDQIFATYSPDTVRKVI